MEIWKEIIGYEGLYEVSTLGRIRRMETSVPCKGNSTRIVKSKIRMQQLNPRGYAIAVLSKESKLKTLTVHQLVAQVFIPGFQKGTELNHIDGDKANPALSNLEVSNPSHNQFHAVRMGLKPKQGKSSQYRNVHHISRNGRWGAGIRHDGKNNFGFKEFQTEIEAASYIDELLDSVGCTQRLRNFPKSP